jgi:hypothetical protein
MLPVRRSLRAFAVLSAALLLSLGVVLAPRGVSAQDMAMAGHPGHIHSGTCAELGDVVFPLSDVSASWLVDGTPMAGEDMMGGSDAIPVMVSVTTVGTALADVVSGGHSINIHESAENIGNYIACGDIGGAGMGATDLAIGLGELNDSGYSGVARLHDNGDDTTTVTVYLVNSGGMM